MEQHCMQASGEGQMHLQTL